MNLLITTANRQQIRDEFICTSAGAPGLWQSLISPFLSSFSPRRNSLLRSVLRRISFSREGVMSIGGVVLEGGYRGREREGERDRKINMKCWVSMLIIDFLLWIKMITFRCLLNNGE